MKKHIVYVGKRPLEQLHCTDGNDDITVITHELSSIQQLLATISTIEYHIDVLLVDADLLYSAGTKNNSNMFEVTNTLHTVLKLTQGANTTQTPLTSSLVVVADVESAPDAIREVLSINDVKGLFPCGKGVTVDEQHLAMQDLLLGKCHIPKKVQHMIRRRRVKEHIPSEGIVLTPRQQQILKLVTTRGASNKVIAKSLSITASTVKLHMTAILKKYGVRSRTQLAVFAHSNVTGS